MILVLLACQVLAAPSAALTMSRLAADVQLASISSGGTQGNGMSWWSAVSANGAYIAFSSEASNLVAGDTNHLQDVFLRDQLSGQTSRISVSTSGDQAFLESGFPDISGDGRYIVFHSAAPNLVPGDLNGSIDIFLYDRLTSQISLISKSSVGAQGNGESRYPSISNDGRYVAFQSAASNLVESDTNAVEDVFRLDLLTGEMIRVSVSSDGTQGNQWSDQASISPEGNYVAFRAYASNLVPVDDNNLCDTDQDGNFTDNCPDIFLHSMSTGETTMASVTTNGEQGNNWSGWPVVSSYGNFVAFKSWAEDLIPGDTNAWSDIFLRDVRSGATTRISVSSEGMQGDCYSDFPAITADGRYIAYESCASNLVEGDTNARFDIFQYDRLTHRTARLSLSSAGIQADGSSSRAYLSPDGRFLAFDSDAENLVPGDVNQHKDVFVYDRGILSSAFLPVINR